MSPRAQRWLVGALLVAGVLLALTVGDDALARVGGGHSYSSGRSSSSGGGSHSGGGGGGGDGDALFFLIWLLINYPAIGIPVLLIVVIVVLVNAANRRRDHAAAPPPPPPPSRPDPLNTLAARDPAFSTPVFLDFLQLLHRRATEAAPRGDAHPFVSPDAAARLRALHEGVTAVDQLVCAKIDIADVSVRDGRVRVRVDFADSRRERTAAGERRVYVEERWTLARAADAVSPAPDRLRRLGCPSCGAAAETDVQGRCTSCQTPIADGRIAFRVEEVAFTVNRRPLPAPEYAPAPGGEEPGYRAPSRRGLDLARKLRALTERHGGFAWPELQQKLEAVFLRLQAGWSDGDPDRIRPFVTDNLYQSLRFWLEGYRAAGVRNVLLGVRIHQVELTDVQLDPWYSAVTIRIWGEMIDTTVDAHGQVVGGNADTPRRFSEYWTLLRAAGGPATAHPSPSCPSCSAPLDRVDATGVCGYCETRITTGEHDWVLSRIEQA